MIEPMSDDQRLTVGWKSLPFLLVHLACLAALWLPFSWEVVALCVGLYFVRMFGITAGYHRYFSHRTFKTSRFFQFVLAALGTLSMQKGPLWWSAHHRHHHRHSDLDGDRHSPRRHGFLWAHVGWVLSSENDPTDYERVADLAKFPELVWLNRLPLVPPLLFCIGLYLVGGFPWLVWGGFISTVLSWHATFFINSLTHMIGRRRYLTHDDSRNSLIMALVTMGEGWHNNHHYFKASTRQGFFWWEIDATYYLLRGLAIVGVVWDLKEPPEKLLAGAKPEPGGPLLDPLGIGQRRSSSDAEAA